MKVADNACPVGSMPPVTGHNSSANKEAVGTAFWTVGFMIYKQEHRRHHQKLWLLMMQDKEKPNTIVGAVGVIVVSRMVNFQLRL